MKSQLLRSAGRGILVAGLFPLCLAAQAKPGSQSAVLIRDALIYDGTGSEPVRGSVRIRNGKIADVIDAVATADQAQRLEESLV